MSTINYAEDLFEAISTIVEKRISNLEFDKTIICTITDTSKAATQNLYTVTDGSISFEVQSNGGTYAVNDQVRVSIVNGDFSKDKFIQGKYNAADATKPITYVSPLNSVVKITDNLLTGSNETHGIAANGNVEEIPVGEIIFDEDIQNKDLFDTLYLSAEFQTNFDQYKMQQGSYGLHVMFAIEKNEGEYDRLDIYFDIMDMFGNPYAFKIFTQQEIKYNFSEQLEGLVGAKIYLYQNNDFQYLSENGNKENYTPTEISGNIISDIFVKNIIFGFGSEVTSISGRKLKLYTNDELKYRADGTEVEAVTKNLKLLWYNSDVNNMYVGFSDGEWIADDEGKYSYDEEDYLLAAAANTRLLSRKTEAYPDDEVSLGLAADIYDIKNEALKAYKLIGKDIKDLLKSFQDYTRNVPEWETEHPTNALLATGSDADNSLATYAKSIEDTSTELKNLYNNILTQAKKIKKSEQEDFTDINFPASDPHLNFAVNIDAVNNAVNAMFATSDSILKNSAWDGIYTNYSNQWKTLEGQLEKIKTNLNKCSGLPDDISNYEELKQILDNKASNLSNTSYSDLTKNEDFIKQWDNKYCLYWYRYTKDLTLKDRFMSAGWERIDEFTNKGLPGKDDDTNYLQQKLSASESSIISPGLRAQNEEKFKILLFYNHEQIQSNELIFENLIEFPDVATVNAAASIKINNKGDKTQDTYQLYNATGWLINAADAQVKRELIAEYDGVIGGNEKLIGHTIKWSVPKSATMIDIFDSEVNQFTIDDSEDESYIHYSKVIGAHPDDETKVNEAHLVFPYHIKNYYQQTAARNTILCNVDTWYGAKSITFASFGTNGTDYTLVLLTNPQQPMVTDDDEKPLNITTKLYDYDNNEITPSEDGTTPAYTWEGPTGYKYDNEKEQITKDDEKSGIYAGILHCTTTIENKLKLSTQLTVPYGYNENYYIEGANSIIYDSNGGNPQYYKNPYRLYELGGEVENVTWSIIYYDKDGNEIKEESDTSGILKYVPRLVNNTLVPSIMYITPQGNNVIYPVVLAKDNEDKILWAQPILITQNVYSSSLLNEWDGSLSIDKENGTILSTMVGAGRKNDQNQFEGVLMGDVTTGSGDDAVVQTGLYGYHNGAQSFGFKVDGTAFIGKSGKGRIDFNGNKGIIQSGNYNATYDENGNIKTSATLGMKIDLENGSIDAYNFSLTANSSKGYLELSSDPNKMLKMVYKPDSNDDELDISVLEINTSNYLLQSFNYSPNYIGMQIDIGKGKISFYDSNLPPEAKDTKAILLDVNNTETPFQVGLSEDPTFKLNWDGSLIINKKFYIQHDGTMWSGHSDRWQASFQVSNEGILTATGASLYNLTVANAATIQGKLTSNADAEFKDLILKGKITIANTLWLSGGKIGLGWDNNNQQPLYQTDDNVKEYTVLPGWFKEKLILKFYNGILVASEYRVTEDSDKPNMPNVDNVLDALGGNSASIANLQSVVGDNTSGLVKDVNDLWSIVGQNEGYGLQKKVKAIEDKLDGYATQTWVQQQKYLTAASLSNYITKDTTELNNYYTKDNIDNQLTNYVLNTTLSNYAATTDLIKLYGAESIPNENPLTIAGNADTIAKLQERISELLDRIEVLEGYHSTTEEEPTPEPTE